MVKTGSCFSKIWAGGTRVSPKGSHITYICLRQFPTIYLASHMQVVLVLVEGVPTLGWFSGKNALFEIKRREFKSQFQHLLLT